ncbi:MAG: FAD:protein FMN transferase [Pseudomonadota bacterium]
MNSLSRCKPLLGTYVEINIESEKDRETLLTLSTEAFAKIERIEQLMSFHNPDSELSFINKHAFNYPCSLSLETETVIQTALDISQITNGIFDVTIAPVLSAMGLLPDINVDTDESANWRDIDIQNEMIHFNKPLQIDLGGIAKGYAVDLALSIFDDSDDVVINAGGDMKMSQWQNKIVGIRHPDLSKNKIIDIPMRAAAVATSANYYLDGKSAIISPATKHAIKDDRSISIFADNCMHADALTKVAFLHNQNESILNQYNASIIKLSDDDTEVMK